MTLLKFSKSLAHLALFSLAASALAMVPDPRLPSVSGQWELNDGRQVIVHEDQTAEVRNPRTGAREKVGEWRQETSGEYVFAWKGGDRHVMKIAEDGSTMQGDFHASGRLAKNSVTARRMEAPPEEAEQPEAGYFGSSSPSGEDGISPDEEETSSTDELSSEENVPPESEESYGAEKAGIKEPQVERTETEITLLPQDARLSGSVKFDGRNGNIGSWSGEGSAVSWSIASLRPGTYNVFVEHSVGMGKHGGRFDISTESSKSSELVRTTGGWMNFKRKSLGTVKVTEADETITLTATKVEPGAYLMNIQRIQLKRQ